MRTTLQLTWMVGFLFNISVLFSQPVIKLQTVYSGFSQPICLDFMDDHLYVTQQDGFVRIIDPMGNTIATPFLDISSLIINSGERGLLGFAFHPDYLSNGYFYVYYTRSSDNAMVLARYSRSAGNPLIADFSSGMIQHVIAQPFTNHNGGDIKFGPDGMLYLASGDGGSGGDPQNNSQNLTNELGKILRFNVGDGTIFQIPADNPFVGVAGAAESIWAYGLRNPWRFNFGASGIWIADVGQNEIEEVNLQASNLGGVNYGWRCYEGNEEYNTSGCGPIGDYTFPVYQYNHSFGSSITGGYQYAGSEYPLLSGYYVCADFSTGRFFTIHNEDGSWVGEPNEDHNNFQFATFGQDPDGNMYVAGLSNGTIYKIQEFCSDYIPTAVYDQGELSIEYFGDAEESDVSIQWYLDGIMIPDATSSVYVPLVDGDYSVEVSHNIEDCTLTSDELFVDVTILDLTIMDWDLKCDGKSITSKISWSSDDLHDKLILQGSRNNEYWYNIRELKVEKGNAVWDLTFEDPGINYLRISSENTRGDLAYSSIKYIECEQSLAKIYPSPAKHSFFIETDLDIKEVELYDMKGRMIQFWNKLESGNELMLHNYASGIYSLRLIPDQGEPQNLRISIQE